MSQTSVSVIMPTWNRAQLTKRALKSVFAQSHPADEVIVVDDGSTDNTVDFIKQQYPKVRLLTQENAGVSAARNLGIRAAQGNWICLLDSDDVWHATKLEKQLQALAAELDYLLCHTNEIWIRNGVRVNQMKKTPKTRWIYFSILPALMCNLAFLCHNPSSTIGRSAYLMKQCLPARIMICGCVFARIIRCFILKEELITKYGGHDDQLSQKYWGMDRFRIYALEKIISDPKLSAENRDVAITMMLKKIEIYLAGAKKHNNAEQVEHFTALLKQYSAHQEQSKVAI